MFEHGNAGDLARAMLRFDGMPQAHIDEACAENVDLARQYDCHCWADRVVSLVREQMNVDHEEMVS